MSDNPSLDHDGRSLRGKAHSIEIGDPGGPVGQKPARRFRRAIRQSGPSVQTGPRSGMRKNLRVGENKRRDAPRYSQHAAARAETLCRGHNHRARNQVRRQHEHCPVRA